jgi:hypothetical protein
MGSAVGAALPKEERDVRLGLKIGILTPANNVVSGGLCRYLPDGVAVYTARM